MHQNSPMAEQHSRLVWAAEMRLECLRQVMQSATGGPTPEQVIDAAKKFSEFVLGE